MGALALMAWVGLSFLLTAYPDRPGENPGYRRAAERALGGEQFYRPEDPSGCFTYPPFMVTPYLPLTLLPDRLARAAWTMMNLALLATIGCLIARMAAPVLARSPGMGRLRPWMVAIAVGLLSLRFQLSELAYQGHDYYVFLFAMLAISAWGAGASFRLGGFAGVAAACKATPLLFLPVFLWQRRWRAALAMTAAAAGATLLPDLLFRNPEGVPWVATWYRTFVAHVDIGAAPNVGGAWNLWNPLNQSLSGTLYRLFTQVDSDGDVRWDISLAALSAETLRWLSIAAKLGVLGGLLFCVRPRSDRGLDSEERSFRALGQGGAVLCGMLLLSPMSSVQHFCFLLAPISFLAVDFVDRRRDSLVGTGLALFALSNLVCHDIVGSKAHLNLQAYGLLTWITIVTLGLTGYALDRRARGARIDLDSIDDEASPAIVSIAASGERRRRAA